MATPAPLGSRTYSEKHRPGPSPGRRGRRLDVADDMTTNDSETQDSIERGDVIEALLAAGYSDHEAAAQLAIPQTHLTDWTERGGAA